MNNSEPFILFEEFIKQNIKGSMNDWKAYKNMITNKAND